MLGSCFAQESTTICRSSPTRSATGTPVTRIERHLFFRILGGYALFTSALVLFFIILHYVEYADDFMSRGAQMREVFLVYYPAYVPEIIRLISPLSLFLSALYLTARMALQLQFTALHVAGVSNLRLLLPYGAAGVLVTGALFWVGGFVAPVTQRTVLKWDAQYLHDEKAEPRTSDLFRQNAEDSYLTVGYYDPEAQTGYRVALVRFEGSRVVHRMDVARMIFLPETGGWRLEDGMERTLSSQGLDVRTMVFQRDTTLNVGPAQLAQTARDVEAMTIPEARVYLEALSRTGTKASGAPWVHYHAKYAYPVAHLILALLALPVAVHRRRAGMAFPMATGLFLAFVYLSLQKLTEPFGFIGMLSPVWTVWLPHLLFGMFTLLLPFLLRSR